MDRERETPEVAQVFHKLEFEKYAWLALVNKALVILNKWELSPTHVICVFLPPAPPPHGGFIQLPWGACSL